MALSLTKLLAQLANDVVFEKRVLDEARAVPEAEADGGLPT
jgi:hypothetical protein